MELFSNHTEVSESIFRTLASIATSSGTVIASPNAVIDEVSNVPICTKEFADSILRGEARFNGHFERRLGGGAINFALAASFMGAKSIYFAGFLSHDASDHFFSNFGTSNLMLLPIIKERQHNTVVELLDGNYILTHLGNGTENYTPAEITQMISKIKSATNLTNSDWIALCSFSLPFIHPLLEFPTNFFLDSGYGNGRKIHKILTAFCNQVRSTKSNSNMEIMIAANELEMSNIIAELSDYGFGPAQASGVAGAFSISTFLSSLLNCKVSILYHTADLATLAEPDTDTSNIWSIPTFNIPHLARRTNAGDTFAGCFLAAYRATHDPKSSILLANLATAKRLADNVLPTPTNTQEFLKRVSLKRQCVPNKPLSAQRSSPLVVV